MLELVIASDLAVRATRQLAGSARPDAPVVVPRERPHRTTVVRARVAARLHRVASALEPAPRRLDGTPACR
jgi:hypothetical protein